MLKNKVEVNMKKSIAIRSHFDLKRLEDVLCSASQGIEYWAGGNDLAYDSGIKKALTLKGLEIQDWEGGDDVNPKIYNLNLKNIKKGLTLMAKKSPDHFADIVQDNADMVTGDVLVQYSLFGELIYG